MNFTYTKIIDENQAITDYRPVVDGRGDKRGKNETVLGSCKNIENIFGHVIYLFLQLFIIPPPSIKIIFSSRYPQKSVKFGQMAYKVW